MNCERCRESISARLDGEGTGVIPEAIEAHLHACSACREFEARAAGLRRRAAEAKNEPAPDLTPAILVAIGASEVPVRPSAGREAADTRLGLAALAVVQLALALPALVGGDPALLGGGDDVSAHVARHIGALGAALAVGFLAVAWRPSRAEGLLPVAATLVVGLVVASGFDLSAGRTAALGEARHVLEIAGLVFVWLLRRENGAPARLARA